jgi:SAM-dependent methyltransferase
MTNASDTTWYDDDTFWQLFSPFMFGPERFEMAKEQVLLLQELSGCTGGSVLDLACGPGRFVVPFAKLGYTVTGVDRTAYLLEKARAYAAQEQVDVEFVQEDMRRFVRPGAFDLVVNLFTSFGYFADPADNQLVLENMHTSLARGGAFVLDVMGKETIARTFRDADVAPLDDGSFVVQQRDVVNDWCEMDNYWTLVKDGQARTFHIRHWIYSGWELKQMLLAAGFAEVALHGNLAGAPYDSNFRRLIAVARKA